MMDNIRPIRSENDYDWALNEIEVYFDNQPEPGTPEADRFDILATLIEAYEDKHWIIDAPDPVDAIQHALKLRGEKKSRLAEILGSRSRASEVLNRKRSLSLGMIQKISKNLSIPADILIQPYHLDMNGTIKPKPDTASGKKTTRRSSSAKTAVKKLA